MPFVTLQEVRDASRSLDVFVSYAHVDDQPVVDTTGWVTRFVTHLDRKLSMLMGRQGATIFMDHSLVAGADVSEVLKPLAQRARTMLLFLSRGYQQSDWCRTELGSFIEAPERGGRADNVIVVEMIAEGRATWPASLRNLTTVQMWVRDTPSALAPRLLGDPRPSSDECSPYWLKVNDLAFSLQTLLASAPPPPPPPPPGPQPAPRAPGAPAPVRLWVAQPTTDLVEHWDRLKALLNGQPHVTLLPPAAQSYPLNSAQAFKAAAEKDLESCEVLVQLFGPEAGDRFDGSTLTPIGLQAQLVRLRAELDHRVRVLNWRVPGLKLAEVADEGHRRLLTGASSETFEQFRNAVLAACGYVPPPPPPPVGDALGICVTAGASDDDTSERLLELIDELGHRAVQPPLKPAEDQGSGDYQAQVDEIIGGCDATILIYGRESAAWLQAQYLRAQRLLARRSRRLWGALLDAPPPKAQAPRIVDRRVMPLNCRDGLRREEIQRFLDELLRERAGG